MLSPFPGMDPYLEDAENWRDVHHYLITSTAEQLQPQLIPRGYVATIEGRTFIELVERPIVPVVTIKRGERRTEDRGNGLATLTADKPVRYKLLESEVDEPFIQVREIGGNRSIVCGIEVLSPSNKRAGEGRRQYLEKRQGLRSDGVSIVEIDLLRAGKSPVRLTKTIADSRGRDEYIINVVRAGNDDLEFYPVALRERLPCVGIPLRHDEPDAVVDLQAAIDRAYRSGGFEIRLDYSRQPRPRLGRDNAAWAEALLVEKGLRPSSL